MTTQPLLRIYLEPAAEIATAAPEHQRDGKAAYYPLAAVVFSAALHLVVLGGASIAAVMSASRGGVQLVGAPAQPLHTVFVALVLAQCGLAAVYLARCTWPFMNKLIVTSLILGGLWLLLVGTMETSKQSPVAAGAWAACLVVEAVVVWLFVTTVELRLDFEPAIARTQFGLIHLLIGTTLVAVGLGGSRIIAGRYGFTLADVPEWTFFWHVQLAAVVTAVLAVVLYSSLRLARSWITRASFCIAMLAVVVFAAPLGFLLAFKQNISLTEMRWLFGSEGLFLIATLAPMEILRGCSHILK
jgi:hypothetical protein